MMSRVENTNDGLDKKRKHPKMIEKREMRLEMKDSGTIMAITT